MKKVIGTTLIGAAFLLFCCDNFIIMGVGLAALVTGALVAGVIE